MLAEPAAEDAPARLLLPVVLLAVFVMPISVSGTAIALPGIAADLGSSPTALQWVVNGFNAAFAVFTLVWGVLSDRLGYRRTFLVGAVIIVAASVTSAAAPSLAVLDVGRLLAGVGGAAVFTGASAMLSNTYQGAARQRAFAFFGTTIGLGLALGPTISGGLIAWVGWRGVFAAFAVVLIAPLSGGAWLPRIRHDTAAGKVLDLSLIRNCKFAAFALVPVAAAVGYVTVLSYLPVALSAVWAISPGMAGVVMLPMTIPVLLGPLVAAKLISAGQRVTAMTMMYVSLVCLAVGDLGLLALTPSNNVAWLVPPMIMLGFGFGFPIGLVDGEALAVVPARSSGTAAGVVNFLRLGSEALVVGAYAAVLAALLRASISDPATARRTAAGEPGQAAAYAAAFHWMVIAMAILVVAIAAAIAVLHRTGLRHDPPSFQRGRTSGS